MHAHLHTPGFRIALLLTAALAIGACTTGPKTFSNESPAGKFNEYQTYSFAERLDTDDDPEIRSLLSQFLISEISAEMNRRGYRQVGSDADLTINMTLITQEKIRSTPSGSFGGYYGRGYYPWYGYGYAPWYGYGAYDYGTRIIQYTEGTLRVALVDNSTRAIVWEGVSISRITDEVRENLAVAVKTAVGEMFLRYPYVAAGTPEQRTLIGAMPQH